VRLGFWLSNSDSTEETLLRKGVQHLVAEREKECEIVAEVKADEPPSQDEGSPT